MSGGPMSGGPMSGGPMSGGPMSPSGERHRRKLQYRKTQSNARAGPSPGGQPFAQQQQGFGGPGMNYQQMQTPQSAGGYGRGAPQQQQQQQQWGQPQQGNFNQNGFGGYQG
jgi:nucleolysin TIA-1/TIAR